MRKLISILLVCIIFLSGCSFNQDLFKLDDEFYADGKFIEITSDEFNQLKNGSYILYTYNNFCALAIPCEDIFKDFMDKYKIDFISMKFEEFKKIKIHDIVKFAPSVIIIHNGEVVDFLDSDKDEDLGKFQNVDIFEQWIRNYIELE